MEHLHYHSIEMFQSALAQVWNVEITQSDPGPLDIRLSARRVGDCLLYSGTSNQDLLCSGQRSAAFWTISPITSSASVARYRGQTLNKGDILLQDPGGDVYQQIKGGHRQEAISIPVDLVERILRIEHQVALEDVWKGWCVRGDSRINFCMLILIHQLLSGQDAILTREDADLAGHIIAMVQQAKNTQHLPSSYAARSRIVRRGEELIRARLDNPPSVTELCEATHASRRLLFYAFKEILGRSPSSHSKVLRLHRARLRILSRQNEPCVQQIAYDLGFLHPGQFAIDYARLFGESPRQTRLGTK
ncbi:helix-turn-helix domain-containing protein [Halomonas sp.]|uniref:AraC family transcriptional regulator n=1 Tax=Halomonas sp. TaxID=1486246 RepID=UPI0025C73B7F|nr:helix-turn-helix domain-containing protein [Halomonas sp.]